MDYRRRTFQISYEATCLSPKFELIGNDAAVRLLSELYDNINPRFPIDTQNLHVLDATTPDDVRVRLELFSGNGTIEASASKFGALFKNAIVDNDLNIIKDCIQGGVVAFRTIFPGTIFKEEEVHGNFVLDIQGDASEFIRTVAATRVGVTSQSVGATKLHYGAHYEFENEQNWLISFDVQRMWNESKALYVFFHSYFRESAAVPMFTDKIDLIYKAFRHIIEGLGLTESPPTSFS